MISVAPTITNSGKSLLIRSLGGETITFTKFKIGNGELPKTTDVSTLTELINPLVEFSITEIDTATTGYVKLTGTFDSTNITNDFRWRELGIFCKGEDNSEVLYAYANDASNAGMLKADSTDVVSEQKVALVIAVGDTENVTAIILESVLYARKDVFEAHVANKKNPHEVTKADVELGNVPNLTTNDQTPTYTVASANTELKNGERLYVAFGKIAKAVKSLISHLNDKNNPHGIKATDIGAASKEHTHSAADINSGTLSVVRGGTGKTQLIKNGIMYANGINELSQVRVPTVSSYLTQNNGSFAWVPADKVGGKTTRFVVGTSTNGWSAENCDYLCDGVDDQIEINMALAALPSTGGMVVLLDGNYNIDGDINVTKEYSILYGTGASVLLFSGAFFVSVNANNCTIQDIILQGSSSTTNSSGISAMGRKRTLLRGLRTKRIRIYLKECTNSIVIGNFIGELNNYNHGICLEGGKGNLVANNNTTEAYYGIYANRENNLSIIGNSTAVTNEYGIYCTQCNDVTVTGNVVYSNVGGSTIAYNMTDCKRISFCNNSGYLEGVASGDIARFSSCSRVTIMGNILKNLVSTEALCLYSCSACIVIGNMLISTNSSYAYTTSSCSSITYQYNQTFTENE